MTNMDLWQLLGKAANRESSIYDDCNDPDTRDVKMTFQHYIRDFSQMQCNANAEVLKIVMYITHYNATPFLHYNAKMI